MGNNQKKCKVFLKDAKFCSLKTRTANYCKAKDLSNLLFMYFCY